MRWRYTRVGAVVVPILLGLGAMVVEAYADPSASAALLAIPAIGFPMLVIAARLRRYALIPLMARRTYRQTRSYHEEWSVELTRSGTRSRAAGTDHFVAWNHYVAWSETDKVVLLYHSDMMFQFVPRHAVDADTMQVFHTLAAGLKKR